jgi:hypothetical protein
LSLETFGFERTWLRLSQKLLSKFDIHVFISIVSEAVKNSPQHKITLLFTCD